MRSLVRTSAAFIVALVVAGLLAAPAQAADPPTPDFNGDGFGDMAVSVVGEDIGAVNAGSVDIIFGSAAGATPIGAQKVHQATVGVPGSPNDGDAFGYAIATADFNDDGFSDLAVGVPREDVGSIKDAGAVNVLYGGEGGLSGAGSELFHQNSEGIAGVAEKSDHFGSVLAAGDFNGDGYADLAVGTPDEDVGRVVDAGGINVLRGSPAGLVDTFNVAFTQNSPGIADSSERSDHFGAALAAGDFNGDGKDDLVIGVPWEDLGSAPNAGGFHAMYGAAEGLSAVGNRFFNQGTLGSGIEWGDEFGSSLAAGDINGDGKEDVAVGAPKEDVGAIADAGMVHIVGGSPEGLVAEGSQAFHQDTLGVLDEAEHGDLFAWSLATGDINGNGKIDLLVGIPKENVFSVVDAGSVAAFYGSAAGISFSGDQIFSQTTPGIEGGAEQGDLMGWSVGLSDFNDDGSWDMVAGVPSEDVGSVVDAGAMHVIAGSPAGLTTIADIVLDEAEPGIPGLAEAGDSFGSAVA